MLAALYPDPDNGYRILDAGTIPAGVAEKIVTTFDGQPMTLHLFGAEFCFRSIFNDALEFIYI